MISSLRGVVLAIDDGTVELEVHGVGYAVAVTPQHARTLRIGDETLLHTTLIVRDDDLSLCGFETREQLGVFSLLRGVTGVGPKSAMGVLAALTPGQIAAAVEADDDAAFRRVSGIGPKTAKLIVLSLAGKLHPAPVSGAGAPTPAGAVPASARADVVLALVGLGWNERVAAQAVEEVAAGGIESAADVPSLLRHALAHLGPTAVGQGGGPAGAAAGGTTAGSDTGADTGADTGKTRTTRR